MIRINTNNGGYLDVELREDYHPLSFSTKENVKLVMSEPEIVSLYNLINYAYTHGVSIEKLSVYSDVYDEIERLRER